MPRPFALHHLEDEELQVVGFGNAPDNGVVGRLLALLDLSQLHARVMCGACHHMFETAQSSMKWLQLQVAR